MLAPSLHHRVRTAAIAAAFALVVCGTGCTTRRLTVNSNPPGALVLMEGREVGYTPVSVDFTYYGTREITLIKDGFETLTVKQPVRTPWYQYPGLDFFSDNLLFTRITDRHQFSFNLQPKQIPSSQNLLNRAEELRNQSRLGQ